MAGRSRRGERGAALLVAMVAVAVVTVLAVDLAYDTRVSLKIAGNARDELEATYLAKGGVALARVVLGFQKDLDDSMQGGVAGQATATARAATPGQPPGQPGAPGQGMPRPQIWRLVPVDSTLAAGIFGDKAGVPARAPPPPAGDPERPPPGASAGPPPGGFEALLDDEGRKVNAQLEGLGTGLLASQVQALWQLICDPRWDALFDQEDANGMRVSRQELLVYLRDWVDDGPQGSALAASFPATCTMVLANPTKPFEQGFSDKNYPYDRGEDRYRAKLARMDSLGELYLVAGVTDAFMAAFGDALTVYLPRDTKRNVNETDAARLLELAKIVADPPNQPGLYDPELPKRLQRAVAERTFGGLLTLSPSDFGQLVVASGVNVNLNQLSGASPQNPFTDRSSVFRIRSTGRAGDVAKTLDVVVRLDAAQGQAALTVAPGRLVHWREE